MPASDSNNVKAAGRWVSGQFFAYLLSFVFGAGGTLAAIRTGIIDVGGDIDELRREVIEEFGNMKGELSGIRGVIGELPSQKTLEAEQNETRNEIAGVNQNLNTAQISIRGAIDTVRVQLVAKHSLAFARIESIGPYVKQASEGAKSEILAAQQGDYGELGRKIDKLLTEINAVRREFVAELSLLVEDGNDAIRKRNLKKIERWITSSSYFIRSLAIPTESGWMREFSVVKKDLREATERFQKETDQKKKLAHARRVLVIVKAVRDLAEGGQLQ